MMELVGYAIAIGAVAILILPLAWVGFLVFVILTWLYRIIAMLVIWILKRNGYLHGYK